jgi:hypothetical protein
VTCGQQPARAAPFKALLQAVGRLSHSKCRDNREQQAGDEERRPNVKTVAHQSGPLVSASATEDGGDSLPVRDSLHEGPRNEHALMIAAGPLEIADANAAMGGLVDRPDHSFVGEGIGVAPALEFEALLVPACFG